MFENEMKEILDLVLEISTKTDASRKQLQAGTRRGRSEPDLS